MASLVASLLTSSWRGSAAMPQVSDARAERRLALISCWLQERDRCRI
jgi:hypothetical protein